MSPFQVKANVETVKDHLSIPENNNPDVPEGFRILDHTSVGRILVSAVNLSVPPKNRLPGYKNTGRALKEQSGKDSHADAGVLDFFLKHPEEISKSWENKFVYFFGTLFQDSVGTDQVSCLYKRGNTWTRGMHPLNRPLSHRSVVAVVLQ